RSRTGLENAGNGGGGRGPMATTAASSRAWLGLRPNRFAHQFRSASSRFLAQSVNGARYRSTRRMTPTITRNATAANTIHLSTPAIFSTAAIAPVFGGELLPGRDRPPDCPFASFPSLSACPPERESLSCSSRDDEFRSSPLFLLPFDWFPEFPPPDFASFEPPELFPSPFPPPPFSPLPPPASP